MRHRGRPSGILPSSRLFYLGLFSFVAFVCTSCVLFNLGRAPQVEVGVEVQWPEEITVGQGELGLQVFVSGQQTRSLQAQLELVSPTGQRYDVAQRLRVPAGVASRFKLSYQVDKPGLYRGSLKIYDPVGGEWVYTREDLRLVVWPKLQFAVDRSYYTTERVLRFRAQLRQGQMDVQTLAVELRQGDVLHQRAELVFHQEQVEGTFVLGAMPSGAYTLRARLFGATGLEETLELEVYKHPPGRREVKIDVFNQVLLVDGKPFFPIGLYWLRADVLSEVRRLGFNSGDYFYKLQGEEIAQLMDAAAQEGVQILLELSDFVRQRPEPDYAAIEATIRRYKNHPALLAWYIIDEPDETKTAPAHVRQVYQNIQELDPYHPVYLVNNRPHTYADYLDGSDILAVDVYPVPKQPIRRVRDLVQEARWVGMERQPVWLVAQAFGGVEHWPRAPSPVELRNMVYQGLVQGARGIFFYRYCGADERHIQPPDLWRQVRSLAAELVELTPVLMAPERRSAVQVVGSGQAVDAVLKEQGGVFHLLVVNHTEELHRARLRFASGLFFKAVEARYASPQATLRQGELEIDLKPLGVGIYRLEPAEI